MDDTLQERLRAVRCDREAFTPEHASCVCRLTNEAADEIEVLRIRLKDLADVTEPVLSYIPPEMRGEVEGTLAAVRQWLAPPNL